MTDPVSPPPPRPSASRRSGAEEVRRTFVSGLFAFLPLAVTVFILVWVDAQTQWITRKLWHRSIPFVGVLVTLAAIYVTGMLVNSFIGRITLRLIDGLLSRLPVVKPIYEAWKQVALTPGGTEGTFSKVVFIPDESGQMKLLGFTSGRVIDGDRPRYCVFVPSAPNPITGRLYFVTTDRCDVTDLSPEEGFKIILSTGNYVPGLKNA